MPILKRTLQCYFSITIIVLLISKILILIFWCFCQFFKYIYLDYFIFFIKKILFQLTILIKISFYIFIFILFINCIIYKLQKITITQHLATKKTIHLSETDCCEFTNIYSRIAYFVQLQCVLHLSSSRHKINSNHACTFYIKFQTST